MSGFANFPGSDVRAKLDHPVIDADAHVLECDFAVMDFVKQIAGPGMVERLRRTRVEQAKLGYRNIWWGVPSGAHTSDRALGMFPRYFRSRMDELGIDFAHCYTSEGLPVWRIYDDEVRQATCRAFNMLYADMFKEVGDRIRPVALIPTYTPEEAIAELDFAVGQLGHKAIMIGTEIRRPDPALATRHPELAHYSQLRQSIAMDAPYDYDPFWRKCIEYKVTPVCHSAARGGVGMGYRMSPTNYVFNHIGDFADGAEYFCRSVFFGGVTRRFPELTFAFLEGGVGWAVNLLNDIVEHWEKRNRDNLERTLDPDLLDVDLLVRLAGEYGNDYLTPERVRAQPHSLLGMPCRPDHFDEFGACGMTEVRDLRKLFTDRFYFGCEADDRMTAVGFNRRLNPLGAPLKAVFGSDIGHWDVLDATSVLSEAWSLVEAKLMTADNFRDFVFTNPAMMHLSMNPDYFAGTVIEDAARGLLGRKGGAAGRAAAAE